MSKIEWTDKTWNPIAGCTKVSPGCARCYAEKMAARLAGMEFARWKKEADTIEYDQWQGGKYSNVLRISNNKWNGKIICDESALDIPLKRKKPTKYFVCSMSDLFHPKVPFGFIEKVMATIEECSQHTFQVLTKRPDIMLEYFNVLGKRFELSCCQNLWLGTSAENQKYADIRIPYLLQIPAAVRFLSIEPMLGAIGLRATWTRGVFGGADINGIDWVIIGCESNGAHLGRMGEFESWDEMLVAMVNIVDQCRDAGVKVFVKQVPVWRDGKWRLEKDIENFPKSLQYQEYPK